MWLFYEKLSRSKDNPLWASLVRKAFNYVEFISEDESGFRATSIFPINPEVFSEAHFVPAEILQSEFIAVQDCDECISQ